MCLLMLYGPHSGLAGKLDLNLNKKKVTNTEYGLFTRVKCNAWTLIGSWIWRKRSYKGVTVKFWVISSTWMTVLNYCWFLSDGNGIWLHIKMSLYLGKLRNLEVKCHELCNLFLNSLPNIVCIIVWTVWICIEVRRQSIRCRIRVGRLN
jgi:hypothetical protein